MYKKTWMTALAMSVLFLGCQDYGFEELPRSVIKEKRWSQSISVSSAADILFVVDNSGSMAGEQAQLGRSFEHFAQVLEEKFGDVFHIAIITTGMESSGTEGACPKCDQTIIKSCVNDTGENGRFQDRLGHIDVPGDPPIFDFRTDESCRVVTNTNTDCFYDPVQQRGTALVGVNGCGYERGLAPLRFALDNLKGSYNAGFLRSEATLAVIIISDEEDCGEIGDVYELTADGGNICYFAARGEGPDPDFPGPGDPVLVTSHPSDNQSRPYRLTPVEEYHDFLVKNVKGGREGMVKFAAIVGMTDPDNPAATEIDYEWNVAKNRWEIVDACRTPGCTGEYCFAEPSTRYIKLAQLFGNNGFLDTICQEEFSTTMEELGTFVACPRQFKLTEQPLDPDLASILINGEQVPLYSCSIPGRLELCSGPGDSCSSGSCVLTWIYCPPGDPSPECQGLDYTNAAGGVITFAPHYDPCDLITEGEVEIEFVYVPRD